MRDDFEKETKVCVLLEAKYVIVMPKLNQVGHDFSV